MKYTIKKGDTLSAIAETHLGKASRYAEIAARNQLKDADKIQVGQVLDIPEPKGRSLRDWLKYILLGK